ncbi:MAG TPA: hypothetical protein VJY62_10445 [Bacteroidia bacterium]|nr:hypothetical protein [Bacteroidia bacterium]
MKNNLLAFIFKLSAYTLLICLLYFFTKDLIPRKFYFEKTPYLILFFFIVNLVFHAGLLNSAKKNYRSMVTYYMMATALKLFLFLGIIIGYGLLKTGKSVAFISHFFVLYVLFTVFEVTLAYFHFKNKFPLKGDDAKEPEE